jgi:hypothetical protein
MAPAQMDRRPPQHPLVHFETKGIPRPIAGTGDARYRKTAPFRAQFRQRCYYFGGVVESAGGGGVALPLLSDEGVLDGLD